MDELGQPHTAMGEPFKILVLNRSRKTDSSASQSAVT